MKYLILVFFFLLSTNSIKAQSNLIDSLPVEKIDTVSIKIQNDSSLVLNNENNTEVDSAVVGVLTNDMDTSKKTKKQNKKDKKTDTKADKKNQETDTLAFSKQELKKSLKKELDSLWYSMYELSQEDTAILQNLITEKIESLEFALINTRKTDKKFALTDEFTEKALLLFDSADRNYISSDLWTSNNETHDNYTAKEYILDYFPRYAGQKNCWIDFDNVKIISFTQLDSGILNVIASFDSRQYPFKKETQTFREDKRLAYFIIDKNGSQWTAKIKYITYYQPYLYYQ